MNPSKISIAFAIRMLVVAGFVSFNQFSASAQLYTSGGAVGVGTTPQVGIGNSAPGAILDIYSSPFTQSAESMLRVTYPNTLTAPGSIFELEQDLGSGLTQSYLMVKPNGNVGIGTNSPLGLLDLNTGATPQSALYVKSDLTTADQGGIIHHQGDLYGWQQVVQNADNADGRLAFHYVHRYMPNQKFDPEVLVLSAEGDGKVGIGTTNMPDNFGLYVKNGILTSQVKVASYGGIHWPDYVFEEGYRLASLDEVALFIQNNGHLPGVPSAAEVSEEGIDLGQMDATLLEKVEELTLYMIDLKGEVENLKQENESLRAELNATTTH